MATNEKQSEVCFFFGGGVDTGNSKEVLFCVFFCWVQVEFADDCYSVYIVSFSKKKQSVLTTSPRMTHKIPQRI